MLNTIEDYICNQKLEKTELPEKLEILIKTIRVNLLMFEMVGTIGYKKRATEALQKAVGIINNEMESTGILYFSAA
jgi:hypothetical protein